MVRRLFAHIIVNDRPFSDLVLGDYTVVNQGLQHMYVRAARGNRANTGSAGRAAGAGTTQSRISVG